MYKYIGTLVFQNEIFFIPLPLIVAADERCLKGKLLLTSVSINSQDELKIGTDFNLQSYFVRLSFYLKCHGKFIQLLSQHLPIKWHSL